MSSYIKYLKYKNKYLELKNQIGGSIQSAYDSLKYSESLIKIMNEDEELIEIIKDYITQANFLEKKNKIFRAIISKIEKKEISIEIPLKDLILSPITKNNIDWIIQNYKKGTISKISELDTINNSMEIYKFVQPIFNKMGKEMKLINLIDNKFLENIMTHIIKPIIGDVTEKTIIKELIELNEYIPKENIILDTPLFIIYTAKTEKESIILGNNTKWCTARKDAENAFCNYSIGLYIIISKQIPGEKYQLHVTQFKDRRNENISGENLLNKFNSQEFNIWFYETFDYYFKIRTQNDVDIYERLIIKCPKLDLNNYKATLKNFVSVTHLKFNSESIIEENIFPDSLIYLVFYNNQEINNKIFPELLVYLNLVNLTHNIAPNVLPENLLELTFGNNFDRVIGENVLPKNLQKLTFGDNFDKMIQVNVLPNKLLELNFGRSFNQEHFILPPNLQKLTFGDRFNHKLPKLPETLQDLTFDDDFNHKFEQLLPNLLKLKFGRHFNQELVPYLLPRNLQDLSFGWDYNNDDKPIKPKVFPDSLKKLRFGKSFNLELGLNVLPEGLIELIFDDNFDNGRKMLQKDVLPKGLKILEFGECFGEIIEETLNESAGLYIIDILPKELIELTINIKFKSVKLPYKINFIEYLDRD